jgi:hypothetical protein
MRYAELHEVHYTDQYPKSFEAFRQKYRRLARQGRGRNLYVNFTDHADDTLHKSPYDTPDHSDPVGVYAYPLAYVLSHPADIWYGKAARYLRVIESRARNVLHMASIGSRSATRILRDMGFADPESLLRVAAKEFKTRNKGRNREAKAFLSVVQMDLTAEPARKSGFFGKEVEFPIRPGREQTALFRKAGFDALEDRATSNTAAVLNDREPEQIVFLTRNAFHVVEVIPLRPHEDRQRTIVHTAPDNDPRLVRRLAALIAQAMGDGLKEGGDDQHRRRFWTNKGRRIEIDFRRPQRYYDTRKMGEKKHREDKEHDAFFPIIHVASEYGPLEQRYRSDETFQEIAEQFAAEWQRLIRETQPNADHAADSRAEYERREEEAKRQRAREANAKRRAKELADYPKLAEDIAWLAQHLAVPIELPTSDDGKVLFVDNMQWLINHKRQKGDTVSVDQAFDAVMANHKELVKAGIADLTSPQFATLGPLIRAISQRLGDHPEAWQWKHGGPWMFHAAREALGGEQ